MDEEKEMMVYQTERDVQANETGLIEVTNKKSISLQFHAPRRSCRINIHSEAVAMGKELNVIFIVLYKPHFP